MPNLFCSNVVSVKFEMNVFMFVRNVSEANTISWATVKSKHFVCVIILFTEVHLFNITLTISGYDMRFYVRTKDDKKFNTIFSKINVQRYF